MQELPCRRKRLQALRFVTLLLTHVFHSEGLGYRYGLYAFGPHTRVGINIGFH